jgi:hypothetical protein
MHQSSTLYSVRFWQCRGINSERTPATRIRTWRYAQWFSLVSWGGVRLSPLGTLATNWTTVPAPGDRWWWMWSSRWSENWQRKSQYSEKTCPSATLSTINATWLDLGSKQGRHSGKPATNGLSYSTALRYVHWQSFEIYATCFISSAFENALCRILKILQRFGKHCSYLLQDCRLWWISGTLIYDYTRISRWAVSWKRKEWLDETVLRKK